MAEHSSRDVRDGMVRRPLSDPALLAQSKLMTLSERLESALTWNKFASEIRESTEAAKQSGGS